MAQHLVLCEVEMTAIFGVCVCVRERERERIIVCECLSSIFSTLHRDKLAPPPTPV